MVVRPSHGRVRCSHRQGQQPALRQLCQPPAGQCQARTYTWRGVLKFSGVSYKLSVYSPVAFNIHWRNLEFWEFWPWMWQVVYCLENLNFRSFLFTTAFTQASMWLRRKFRQLPNLPTITPGYPWLIFLSASFSKLTELFIRYLTYLLKHCTGTIRNWWSCFSSEIPYYKRIFKQFSKRSPPF